MDMPIFSGYLGLQTFASFAIFLPMLGQTASAGSVAGIQALLRPRRRIVGISAVLLPFADGQGSVDWSALGRHIGRTVQAGLTPALNMDTGHVQLLGEAERTRVLELGHDAAAGAFVAGVHIGDEPGAAFDLDGYRRELDRVQHFGATPIIFPSHGLTALHESEWVDAHEKLASACDGLYAFELGSSFVPYGRIVSLEAYRGLLEIAGCLGAKHSSLSRALEWERIALRDQVRPDFLVLTGNDLAIDMVMYGSDYLLGLSTFVPEAFARRDALWLQGDASFFELNDLLQALGAFSFRAPIPAYKHSAAQCLSLQGFIDCDEPHPQAPRRPESDRPILSEMLERLEC